MVGNIARNIAEEGIIPSRLDITETEMVEMCSVYEMSYDIDCVFPFTVLLTESYKIFCTLAS